MAPTASIRRVQVEPQTFRSISRALSGAVSDGQATNGAYEGEFSLVQRAPIGASVGGDRERHMQRPRRVLERIE
jgi:hypothetical protein